MPSCPSPLLPPTLFFSRNHYPYLGWVNSLYSTRSTLKVQWQPVINPDLAASPSQHPQDERLRLDLSQETPFSRLLLRVTACLLTWYRHWEGRSVDSGNMEEEVTHWCWWFFVVVCFLLVHLTLSSDKTKSDKWQKKTATRRNHLELGRTCVSILYCIVWD